MQELHVGSVNVASGDVRFESLGVVELGAARLDHGSLTLSAATVIDHRIVPRVERSRIIEAVAPAAPGTPVFSPRFDAAAFVRSLNGAGTAPVPASLVLPGGLVDTSALQGGDETD